MSIRMNSFSRRGDCNSKYQLTLEEKDRVQSYIAQKNICILIVCTGYTVGYKDFNNLILHSIGGCKFIKKVFSFF